MSGLSDDQRKRIEENRRKALERLSRVKEQKLPQQNAPSIIPPPVSLPVNRVSIEKQTRVNRTVLHSSAFVPVIKSQNNVVIGAKFMNNAAQRPAVNQSTFKPPLRAPEATTDLAKGPNASGTSGPCKSNSALNDQSSTSHSNHNDQTRLQAQAPASAKPSSSSSSSSSTFSKPSTVPSTSPNPSISSNPLTLPSTSSNPLISSNPLTLPLASSKPSTLPTSSNPTICSNPLTLPSTSLKPSISSNPMISSNPLTLPSTSLQPSISSNPSILPSTSSNPSTLPSTLPSSSTSPASLSSATENVKQLIEEKKKRALEIRARKNSLPLSTSFIKNPASTSTSSSASTSKSSLQQPLAERQNSPNDLWSRIPESGVGKVEKTSNEVKAVSNSNSNTKIENGVKITNGLLTPKTKANCVLVSKNRFKIEIKYHAKSIEVFKAAEEREFDFGTKMWTFPVKGHDRVVGDLIKACPDIEVERLPKFVSRVLHQIRIKEDSIDDPDLTPVGPKLLNKIYSFQRLGIIAGIRNSGRILLADDMGLGKTVQAIGIAAFYRMDWPVLVVCPSSVRFQWNEAFAEWLPDLIMDLDTQVVVKGSDPVPKMRKVVITTYDLIAKTVKDRKFGVVILDESHYIKNEKAARTKAVIPVCQAAKRVMLLSGTPALSRPKELYTQISAIDPSIFKLFHEFGLRYCDAKKNAWGWDYTGSSNMEELQIMLESHLMIRRKKTEVLEELPPKRRQIVHLDSALLKRQNGLKAAKQMLQKAEEMKKKADAQSALLEFFHQTAEAKVHAVCQYLIDRIEGLPKFIIFAHHQNVLDAICQLFGEQKVRFIRIDGSTSAINRQQLADRFNREDDCKAAVLSVMAANAGLNMASASCVIFAEIMWNPGIMVQAEDRAHRIGQRDSVLVQYLLAGGTSDDHVWDMLARKLNVLGQVGLASASDQSFRGADQEYQKVKSDQPTIDSFLSQVENDVDFLHSVATQSGVKDFVSPIRNNNNNNNNTNNNNTGNSTSLQRNGANSGIFSSSTTPSASNSKPSGSRISPTKPSLPPQRNTLLNYFSQSKEDAEAGPDRTKEDAEERETISTLENQNANKGKAEEANEEEFLDDFDWLPPDDEDDPFQSQYEPNKRRRLN